MGSQHVIFGDENTNSSPSHANTIPKSTDCLLLHSFMLGERYLAIPNNSNTHKSFGAWSPVHARARRADRVARNIHRVISNMHILLSLSRRRHTLAISAVRVRGGGISRSAPSYRAD